MIFSYYKWETRCESDRTVISDWRNIIFLFANSQIEIKLDWIVLLVIILNIRFVNMAT